MPSDLSSRKRPEDLPLIKLTAKQLLLGIGQEDLAFTVEEAGLLLQECYGLDEPELAETLAAFSEGWITGIVLGLGNQSLFKNGKWREIKTTGNSSSSQGFDTTGIFDYLAQEVLENQPPEIQDFLLKTSVFEVMKPSECDALLEDFKKVEGKGVSSYSSISEATLQQLESRNLFISQLDSDLTEEITYQYHTLFRQFLLLRLNQKPKDYVVAQLKAADILKNAGALLTSIQHYIKAGATERAGKVLSDVAEQLHQSGRSELLFNLLSKIPLETQKTLPQLLNVQAQLLLERGDNENSLQTFRLAATLFQKEGLIDQAARARANQAQLLARMGNRQEATGLCVVLLQDYSTLMQTNTGQQAIALSKTMLGSMATEEGNSSEAERNLIEAREIYSSTGDEFHLAMVNSYFGRLYHYEGRLVKSNIFYERALSFFVKAGNRLREAYSRLGLAGNLYLQVQYQLAEKQLNEILAFSGDWKDRYLYLYVLNYLGNVYRETERYDKAQASYVKAIEIATELKVRGMEFLLNNELATNYILRGEKDTAYKLITLSLELTEDYKLKEKIGLSYSNQGWLDFSNRSFKRSLMVFEKALAKFVSSKAKLEETRMRLAIAIVLMAMAEPKKALTILTESLTLADELGYYPYLPFELKWAAPLFDYASRKKVTEPVEEFLRLHGFIAFSGDTQSGDESESDEANFIQLEPMRQQKQSKLNSRTFTATTSSVKTTKGLTVFALNDGMVLNDGVEIKNWRTNKTREVLFYLIQHENCTRDELLEALWPEEGIDNSSSILRFTLSSLRKVIAPDVEVKFAAGRYFLEGEIWCDATEFTKEVQLATAGKELDAERLAKTLQLYKRDYLNQIYSNWYLEHQQHLLQQYLKALSSLASFYQEQRQYQNALTHWRQVIRKDAYDEKAHLGAIICLKRLGKEAEAWVQLAQCRKALAELDLEPPFEIVSLFQKHA